MGREDFSQPSSLSRSFDIIMRDTPQSVILDTEGRR